VNQKFYNSNMTNGEYANARLPEDLETPGHNEMEIGESTYTAPWAMEVDTERRCWLMPSLIKRNHTFGGALQMEVTREEEGFVVNVSRVENFTWRMDDATDAEEIDQQDKENPRFLPVIRIIR
jgi:hypothetical protein